VTEASHPNRDQPKKTPIVLLPLSNEVTVPQILSATMANPTVVADCYVKGVESWTAADWGWQTRVAERTLINIDHHAKDKRFFRRISSGNLAIVYVNAHGVLPDQVPALINHTDCDSILSAAILTGLLPPEEKFGQAVIAADHTGEPNAIADLLQALDPMRDVELSLRNLNLLLQGAALEEVAVNLVEGRKKQREMVAALVQMRRVEFIGSVAVIKLSAEEKLSGEFLPSLLPAARVIIAALPMSNGKWETKVRLGLAAQAGETLFSIDVERWECAFRGRWNAGSTRRSGGSTIDPVVLAQRLADSLEPTLR
jgi:hypothetical protein